MRKPHAFLSFLLLIGLIFYSFFSLMPRKGAPASVPETEFSAERALAPLKEISRKPHFIGNDEHARVREYLLEQLRALELEPEVQKGFVYKEWGGLIKPANILAKIPGTSPGNALLVFSHYDSALVPSFGASDAGSGVVTILESLRAYLAGGNKPKNDIIVLFTDGEEIGLDGAKLFVKEHPWAKEVRLALNFEARGSGGPSNMILETNQGNHNIIQSFIDADVKFPVASSLMYSIYKMLPNDTDSTILREDGDIDGLFFAFIDDHFDYHTANDSFENLDRNTLQHQGTYLLPLLHYYANSNLSNLKTSQDDVYFNIPLGTIISYPFSWIFPMWILALLLLVGLVFFGIKKEVLKGKEIGKGFLALLLSLVIAVIVGFGGWKLILKLYPQYNEIQHGFTYNGHAYIAFFVFLTSAICFMVYRRMKISSVASAYVAPITLWIIINLLLAIYLKGGAYFIVPVFFALIALWVLIRQQRPNLLLMVILGTPAILIFSPLIQFFPVGLGLDMLVASCVFTVLLFGLLFSVFGFYRYNRLISILSYIVAFSFFLSAHFSSDYSETRQRPTSLVYYKNVDAAPPAAYWVTYDKTLDDWTQGYLGKEPEEASNYVVSSSGSKYNTGYAFAAPAPLIEVPRFEIRIDRDSLFGDEREITFTLLPERDVHIIRLYADSLVTFQQLSFNGKQVTPGDSENRLLGRSSNFLLHYNVSENDSLEVNYRVADGIDPKFSVLEYSLDLLENPLFTVNKRPSTAMPKPFVTTDAVIVQRKLDIDAQRQMVNDTLIQVANE